MAWLTKSRFLSGLQCHKRLWFEVHQPLEGPAEPNTAILQGRSFDEAVQRLRPGVVISRDGGMPAAIAETRRVLAKGLSKRPPRSISRRFGWVISRSLWMCLGVAALILNSSR
jgi:hypothetical protein